MYTQKRISETKIPRENGVLFLPALFYFFFFLVVSLVNGVVSNFFNARIWCLEDLEAFLDLSTYLF